MFSPVDCAVAGRCAACAWIETPYDEQLARKAESVRRAWREAGLDPALLGAFPVTAVAPAATRDRVDVQFRRDERGLRMGFFADGDILPIDRCPQASPALEQWLRDFRDLVPPVGRGGARLRVAPDGRRGVWLDLANVDVKTLFDERTALRRLFDVAWVEIGQRRKRLTFVEDMPKLTDPEPYPWFETPAGTTTVPVHCSVGGFTQPGFSVNRALVAALLRTLPETSGRWVELGAGVGNFTAPLAARGLSVIAVENDPLALLGLRQTLAHPSLPPVEVREESFAAPRTGWTELLSGVDGIVADPPRSGLGKFPAVLETTGPRHFVYVSCYPESFAADAAKLGAFGYRLVSAEGVDQFPQTPHVEIVARFERH